MKKQIAISLILCLGLPFAGLGAESSNPKAEYQAKLTSGTDAEILEALEYFTKQKDKEQIPSIIAVLRDTDNAKVAQTAAISLGVLGTKGDSTQALKERIEKDPNTLVTYACILALLNIHREDRETDSTAREALEHAYNNKRQDPFVSDILEKLKVKFEIGSVNPS
jgi:HEAT repeat protein